MDIIFLLVICVYLNELRITDVVLNGHWQSGIVSFSVLVFGILFDSKLFVIF